MRYVDDIDEWEHVTLHYGEQEGHRFLLVYAGSEDARAFWLYEAIDGRMHPRLSRGWNVATGAEYDGDGKRIGSLWDGNPPENEEDVDDTINDIVSRILTNPLAYVVKEAL